MRRHIQAILVLLTGLVVGIIGNSFFYDQSLGLSVPIFVSILLALIILLTSRINKLPSIRKTWIIVPILFFAVMFVFRANTMMLAANGLAIAGLFALFVYYLNHERFIDNASSPEHVIGIVETTASSMVSAGEEVGESYKWLKQQNWNDFSSVLAIGRGLLIAIPIIIVFAVLLSSADVIFSDRITGILDIFAIDQLEILLTRFIMTLGIAWLSAGLLNFGLKQRSLTTGEAESEQEPDDTPDSLPKKAPSPFRLGMTETTIVLVSVVLLFGFFVFIQLTYFFAGQVAIEEGLTYSEYARRGFFELLAVSLLTLGLMLVLDNLAIRKTTAQKSIFLGLSVVMVGLTLVIMVSAWQRMGLYEQAYGFTYLRVYSHVFIVWLAVLLAFGLLHLFRVKANIFALGLILVAIGYLGTLNLMNLDRYIAERNIARYHDGEELDVCYLRQLSVDALPPILELYSTTNDDTIRDDLAAWFNSQKYQETQRYEVTSFLEFNLAHQNAWQTLGDMDFDTGNWRYCSYY